MSRKSELDDILSHMVPAASDILWCALVCNDHNFDHADLTEKARTEAALSVPILKVFAAKGFTGHYPVGTSAIVVAPNANTAADMLAARLAQLGLEQKEPITAAHMVEIDDSIPGVLILNDGNY